jgi:Phage portal protein, SPP1 Gp6-like
MPIDTRQYDSAIDFIRDDLKFSRLISNLSNQDDRIRLKSYMLYEDMYHNRPEHIRITLRGGSGTVPSVAPSQAHSAQYADDDEDSIQIYIPSAKKCIEAVNRFLGVGWKIQPDPSVEQGGNVQQIELAIQNLFKRERMGSKFAQMKRYMLVKGDAMLHITADPNRPAGKRISILELRAEHYFPIEDEQGNYIGCHIVDIINNPNNTIRLNQYTGKEVVRRQTYRKELDVNGYPTGRITSELGYFEMGKWDDRVLPPQEINMIQEVREVFYLPSEINQIPVYHWRNMPPPGSFFGTSELSGVESVINAINQSMSDEDLTLIMQGLGVYWTDASPPLDPSGNEVEWEISPRSVVQVASGGQFGRVSGITTVQPFGDHINALDEAMQQALAVPDIAIGVVDVTTAESGIALQLKLGPLLAKNQEKELDILDVGDQFIYDLTQGWMPAYEGVDTSGVAFINAFDDAMPKNKSKDLADLTTLWTTAGPGAPGGCLPVRWFFEQLNNIMGYKLDPAGDFQQALDDAKQIMEAMTPPPPPMPPGGDLVGAGANGAPPTNGQGP